MAAALEGPQAWPAIEFIDMRSNRLTDEAALALVRAPQRRQRPRGTTRPLVHFKLCPGNLFSLTGLHALWCHYIDLWIELCQEALAEPPVEALGGRT